MKAFESRLTEENNSIISCIVLSTVAFAKLRRTKEAKMAQRFYEDFRAGETITTASKQITQEMINAFAELTGDKNPIHLDKEVAEKSIFGGIVAHG